jgi:large subunit ribosomal protein L25
MKSVSLSVFPRSVSKRTRVKKLRHVGRIPAVIYGRQTTPQNLEIEGKALAELIHHSASENILVDLAVEGDTRPKRLALVQEVQHHVLSGKILHVDFHEVSEDEKVTVTVPVESVGEPVGVKTGGGVLEHVLFKLKVRALPKDLPEAILVDVTHLELGNSIHIGEIKAPPGVEILGGKNVPVLSVAAPLTEAQELAAEAAASDVAEPEMIKEKKEEGEGEGAPAGKTPAGKAVAGKAPEKGAEKGAEKAGDKAEKKPEKAEKKK